ncbi:MAG: nucleotidyltransferase domain-containing protein [Bacteroidota bacterium]|nr:nucleotidyltransferase domain-containing protein [Bacteroidota bacterium]
MNENEIFLLIKSKVREVIPTAGVYLFGSRANGNSNEESDWDVLILLTDKPDRKIKLSIHLALFPLSVQIHTFINTVIVSQPDWNNNPCYYSMHQSIVAKRVAV